MLTKPKKILFISYGGGHVTLLDEVYSALKLNTNYQVEYLALTTAFPYLRLKYPDDKRIKSISDYSDAFQEILPEIKNYGELLLEENYNGGDVKLLDSLYYLGLSYWDLVSVHGEVQAIKLYNEKKRQSFYPINVLEKLLSYVKPDLLITTSSPRMEQASIDACKKLGIQNLQILDLFEDVYPLPNANNIVVLNEEVKKGLVAAGVIENTIFPLGQPVLDKTNSIVNSIDGSSLKIELGFKQDQKFVMFCPTRNYVLNEDYTVKYELDPDEVNLPIFRKLEILSKKRDFKILLRPHPNDKIDYKKYMTDVNLWCNFPNEKLDLFQSIAIASAIIVSQSTVALQGLICGKKVFTYNYDKETKVYPVKQYQKKPFIYSDSIEILLFKLEEQLLSDSNINNEFVDISNFYKSGSLNRIENFIRQIT